MSDAEWGKYKVSTRLLWNTPLTVTQTSQRYTVFIFVVDDDDYEPTAPSGATKVDDKWEGEDEEDDLKVCVEIVSWKFSDTPSRNV